MPGRVVLLSQAGLADSIFGNVAMEGCVLSVVNNLKPTAELRPPSADQTDEADLMPYRLLDAIERAAIRDKLLPVEVFEAVRPQFPQYETHQIGMWVERFFRLWCRNQWKRERYAPSCRNI